MIELHGVTRVFQVGGRPVHALRGVDLVIPDGEYLSVMGPSGSGKSTLLNLLGCLDRPTAGSYRLDGEEVGTLDDLALSRIRRHKIGPRMDHRPDQLSGGERQRAAIARATVMGPTLLLADEPTGNLDSVSGGEVVALLEEMNGAGLTLVVVTHDAGLGRRARRQVRMADGAIVDERRADPAAAPSSVQAVR